MVGFLLADCVDVVVVSFITGIGVAVVGFIWVVVVVLEVDLVVGCSCGQTVEMASSSSSIAGGVFNSGN